MRSGCLTSGSTHQTWELDKWPAEWVYGNTLGLGDLSASELVASESAAEVKVDKRRQRCPQDLAGRFWYAGILWNSRLEDLGFTCRQCRQLRQGLEQVVHL